jgi:hypothetical protein
LLLKLFVPLDSFSIIVVPALDENVFGWNVRTSVLQSGSRIIEYPKVFRKAWVIWVVIITMLFVFFSCVVTACAWHIAAYVAC